jgi:hypothetical protein
VKSQTFSEAAFIQAGVRPDSNHNATEPNDTQWRGGKTGHCNPPVKLGLRVSFEGSKPFLIRSEKNSQDSTGGTAEPARRIDHFNLHKLRYDNYTPFGSISA